MTDERANLAPACRDGESGAAALGQTASLETIIAQIDQSLATTRSAQLSKRPEASSASTNQAAASTRSPGKYIVFSLAEARYAVPIGQVLEVGEPQRITPVPNVPDWVMGVTLLRGDIISVVDWGAFLNLHDNRSLEMSSMCVVRNKARNLTTSLMVDRIEGMLNVAEDLIIRPEASLGDRLLAYLHGVYDHDGQLLNVLNLEGLLSSMELSQ